MKLVKVHVWPGEPGYHRRGERTRGRECAGYVEHVHLRASRAIVFVEQDPAEVLARLQAVR